MTAANLWRFTAPQETGDHCLEVEDTDSGK